jgi:integrase
MSGGFQAKIRRKGLPALSKTFQDRATAALWAAEQESRLSTGVPANKHLSSTITFTQALEWYRDNITLKTKRNTGSEEWRIKKLLRGPLVDRPLNTIKPEDLEDIITQLDVAGRSPSTARHYVALISHLFTVHIQQRRMRSLVNPATMIKWPEASKPRRRRFKSAKEEKDLYRELAKVHNPFVSGLAQFLPESAMRIKTEALALRWPQVGLKQRVAMLFDTKNGEDRPVALTPKAAAILKALPRAKGDDRVFPISYSYFKDCWKVARDAIGSPDLWRHDLRREATGRLFEIHKLEQVEAASITGHKTLSMLRDYAQLKASRVAQKLKSQK